jgi:hypothetical protein
MRAGVRSTLVVATLARLLVAAQRGSEANAPERALGVAGTIPRVKHPSDDDPVLRLIDAVLGDIAVRRGMYVGRRCEDGDAATFVIQFGEEGRLRLGLPDLSSDTSMEAVVAEAQARLTEVLGASVPLCPRHEHALLPSASAGQLRWVCPHGEWQCPLGDYAELAWPHFDLDMLAPILVGRLQRRGIKGWITLWVKATEQGPVADFGVPEMSDDLARALRDAATPLPVMLHPESRRLRRVAGLRNDR